MGVSMVQVKEKDKNDYVTKGVRCSVFDYTGKVIVGVGKWKQLVRQAIDEAKKNTSTYWIEKKQCPVEKKYLTPTTCFLFPVFGKRQQVF